jgi:hypothetical protein
LALDFRFKDGREYHETIDIRPLVEKMLNKHALPDLSKSKWGGFASLKIIIQSNKLSIVYRLFEQRKTEDGQRILTSKRYDYTLFEKKLI